MTENHEATHDAEQTRRQVVEELRTAGRALHPLDLAIRLDLHVNTIHRHLEVLEAAGQVVRRPEDRDRPGRPRVMYEAVAEHANGCSAHRFLARALAAYINEVTDPARAGREAGEAWGRHLADARPFEHADPPTAAQRVARMLRSIGMEVDARPEDQTLEVVTCPYPELAHEHPALICNLHLGLIDGALQAYGAEIRADSRPGTGDVHRRFCLTQTDGDRPEMAASPGG